MQTNQFQNLSNNPKEQAQLTQIDLQQYFTFENIQNTNHLIASDYYTNKILGGIDILLNEGVLQINKQCKKAEDLLDVKINQEQVRLEEIKRKKQSMEKQLEYLNNQSNIKLQSGINNQPFQKSIVYSKQEHKTLINKILRQKEERDKQHAQMLKKMGQKIQQQEQNLKKKAEAQKNVQIQMRKRQIERKLMKNKQRYEQLIKTERQSNQKIKELKDHKNAFRKIEQKHQKQILLPLLQDKKQKLKEIRQYRTLSIEEINEHQKKYMEQRRYQKSKRGSVRIDRSYQRPPKPERLSQMLEFEMAQQMRRQQQKKSILQNNLIKKQNYLVHLRENFGQRVKIDPAKQEQILQRLQKKQNEKINSDVDLRKIGLLYLQQSGRRRKKEAKINVITNDSKIALEQQQPEQRAETQKQKTRNTIKSVTDTKYKAASNYDTINRDSAFFQRNRRRKVQKILNRSQLTEAEKIKFLKLESNKITETMYMKELQLKYKKDDKLQSQNLQLLLSSIQTKIGIMQIYQ